MATSSKKNNKTASVAPADETAILPSLPDPRQTSPRARATLIALAQAGMADTVTML